MDELDEKVLDITQRQKRAMILRRYHAKVERARELAQKRLAPEKNIKKRAYAQARQIVRKRFAGARGAEYEKLGPSEKIAIDRAIEKKQALIKKLALRLIPRVKQAEAKRLQAFTKGKSMDNAGAKEGHAPVTEELNNLFAETFNGMADEKKKAEAKASKNDTVVFYGKFEDEKQNKSQVYKAIAKKAAKADVSEDVLGVVYNRGLEAWNESVTVSPQQYAFARVNSFVNMGRTYFDEDADLVDGLEEGRAPGTPSVKRYTRNDGTTALKSLNKWGKRKDWRDTEGGLAKAKEHAGVDKITEATIKSNKDGSSGSRGTTFSSASPNSYKIVSDKGEHLATAMNMKDPKYGGRTTHWHVTWHKDRHKDHPTSFQYMHQLKKHVEELNEDAEVQQTNENFMDGKGPGKPGDAARHGLKGKSASELKKIRSSETASPRKKQLAHWMLNMHHNESVDEGLKDPEDNPCWKGYKPVGTKKLRGKTVPNCVPVNEEERPDPKVKVEGTNCRNCVYWRKDLEKPVTKEELNPNGGLKAPNKEYIAMSKRIDLGTLPGKDSSVKVKGFCDHDMIKDWVTERMCCSQWDSDGMIRDYKGQSPVMEADGESIVPQTTSPGSKIRKKLEVVDRKPPHTEYTRQAEIKTKIIDEEGNSQPDPKKRLIGTDSLVKAFKKDTPGQDINESFNIAYAAGIGQTFTAADLGMKVQGGFALHPSVIEEMEKRAAEEVEEEVRSADVKGVVVRTAAGKTVVRKQKVDRKIIGTGNLTDGKPDDTV